MSPKKQPLNPSKGLLLFTDGSADSKDRSGGWAWLALDAFGKEISGSGGESDTTNNRCELIAWIEGLNKMHSLFGECKIIVCSDSKYVGLGAMDRERNRNKNNDLWYELDQAIDNHLYVEFNHVKGHADSGNADSELNKRVDKMAGIARKQFRDQKGECLTSND